ncbi:hydroxymyristoyl-ACP dehydratase [Salegentibacter sp. F188]|uniref:Hydroxymyristoyl-ACP dehydratase n=1 Tax=Autumnicola patrickiae TaxID=3075591 RepID=A0ABU3E2T1_9FLAO|nr:hydroxymyristoyl-ACP dehydratase [Salegentibacter sp. F188]MDT0690208.1 hydroxymyristoyl-ACP dehydratase [Salegentibacter sp. F188]
MLLKEFYSVINTREENGHFVTEIKIRKDHELYKGHFPDRPVTPGVILMQMFKEELERQTGRTLQFSNASNVKFSAVVDPNIDNVLVLESKIEVSGDVVNLKGIARNNGCAALKINATYNSI